MEMENYINWIQLIANSFALGAAGWIYRAYILKLKASLSFKDEQIKAVEKNLNLWKDKAADLEKKTPDFMENALSNRIKVREEEIERLNSDKENNEIEIAKKNEELSILRNELEKTRDVQRSLSFVGEDFDDYFFEREGKLEIEEAGIVSVDSGQLMITDPLYIDTEWQDEEYEDLRLYKHIESGKVYQYDKDFTHYDNVLEGLDKSVNELIKSKQLIEVKLERDLNYSFAGAAYATLSENQYGELKHQAGHEGAGVVFSTAFGDGIYPVYIEKYGGRNIRAYVNLV